MRDALNRWVLACCCSRKESGLGPFPAASEKLQCKLLAVPCQKLSLAARSLLLAWQAAASTSQLLASHAASPWLPAKARGGCRRLWSWSLAMPCPCHVMPSVCSHALGNPKNYPSHGLISVGDSGGIRFCSSTVQSATGFENKKYLKNQRCLTRWERQKLLWLSCVFAWRPWTTPGCGLFLSQGCTQLSSSTEENLQD